MASGHSDRRTPAKHALTSKVLGQEMGAAIYAAAKLGVPLNAHWLYDLTAGDGIAYHGEGSWELACSPGIFAHHGRYEKCLVPVTITLCEKKMADYDSLLEGLARPDHLRLLGYEQLDQDAWTADNGRVVLVTNRMDSRTLDFSHLGLGDFVFLNNDPNNVHDWALNSEALAVAVDQGAIVRSFSTMGCNPGGLKRLIFEGGRETWFGYIDAMIQTLRKSQDLIQLAIDRDDAQWGYAIVTPSKWVDDDIVMARRVFAKHGMTLTAESYRRDRKAHRALLDVLFRTAKERKD